jgi:hypothetical protein
MEKKTELEIELEARIEVLEGDFKHLAQMVAKSFNAIGIDDFLDNNLGKKIMGAIPGIMTQATIFPKKLEAKFAHLTDLLPLIEKYKHLLTDAK